MNNYHRYKSGLFEFSNETFSEADILKFVRSYKNKNVGLCIYTFLEDKLNVILYTKKGQIYNKSYPITKEELVENINSANNYFSSRSLHRSPILRGSSPVQTSENIANRKNTLHKVREILLPESEMLKDLEHLVIVPTLNIAVLPFSALEISDNTLFIDKMSYSIAPSLGEVLFSISNSNPYVQKSNKIIRYDFSDALLVTNPKFSVNDIWDFPPLPGTEEEGNKIKEIIGEGNYQLLNGEQATSGRISYLMKKSDLLYFATHGISDSENSLDNSFLALAQDDRGSKITAREIQHTTIGANLVVLSACQTGLGKEHEGGIIGLARAFQIAGAKNILSSLWNIDDKETVFIMTEFFKNIKQGGELMPHEALRKAILKYKNEVNSDPYYWSAFMIFGVPY